MDKAAHINRLIDNAGAMGRQTQVVAQAAAVIRLDGVTS